MGEQGRPAVRTVEGARNVVPAQEAPVDRAGQDEPTNEVVPDLLWVESVSERLLGGGGPPRPWEEAFFGADSPAAFGADGPAADTAEAAHRSAAQPGVARRSVTEADADWVNEAAAAPILGRTPEGRPLLDLTREPVAPAEDSADRALRLALKDPAHPLSTMVLTLLAERADDRAQLQRLRAAVEALLAQAPPGQAALLRQLLGD